MGHLAHSLVSQAKEAFAERNVDVARDLARQDEEINRLNRDVFSRAVEIGDDKESASGGCSWSSSLAVSSASVITRSRSPSRPNSS